MVTLLVLLIDASTKSASQAPARTLAGQAWYDRVRPLITASEVTGRQLVALRSSTSTVGAGALESNLRAMVDGTSSTLHAYQRLRAPSALQGEAGLLETCLLVRDQATANLAVAVRRQLSAPARTSTAGTSQAVARSSQQLQVADAAYQLFANGLPASLGVRAPGSVWVSDPTLFTPTGLQVWLTSLHSRISLAAVHSIAIVALSTNPAPIDRRRAVQILTPSSQLVVTVVVGDTGNQPEPNLTVIAAISNSTGTSSKRDFVDLAAGSAKAITFAPLGPVLGHPDTLTVTVTPLAGSPTKAQVATLTFLMPAPSSSSTTSSTSSTTSTTLPGGAVSSTTGTTGTTASTTTTTAFPTNSTPGSG